MNLPRITEKVRILVLLGIIGVIIGPSVSTIPSVEAETWYGGKGLKQGDFFRYSVCYYDWKNCAPIEIDFWVQNQTSDGNWNLQFVAIDGKNTQKGTVTIGGIAPYSLNYSSNLSDYVNVYNNTIGWINYFSSKAQPKSFDDPVWGKWGRQGLDTDPSVPAWMEGVGPKLYGKVTVAAGTFDAWTIWWNRSGMTKILIVPSLPFPIKGILDNTYLASVGSHIVFNYELLQIGNSQTPPPQIQGQIWVPPPVPYTSQQIPQEPLSPFKQFKEGIKASDVKCKESLQLIIKLKDNSPACVTSLTGQILVERGWGKEITSPVYEGDALPDLSHISLTIDSNLKTLHVGDKFTLMATVYDDGPTPVKVTKNFVRAEFDGNVIDSHYEGCVGEKESILLAQTIMPQKSIVIRITPISSYEPCSAYLAQTDGISNVTVSVRYLSSQNYPHTVNASKTFQILAK